MYLRKRNQTLEPIKKERYYQKRRSRDCNDDHSLPKLKSMSARQSNNFDKYYINPQCRYKEKVENPKQNKNTCMDQAYIYNNLHNYQFWNWAHPLDQYQLKPLNNSLHNKINLNVLQKFKTYLQKKANKRVPIVIKEMLKNEL